ncbi:protein SHQ1 homolog [Parasteatoda tepidariorum]|uniref:protein SHQ1 homolog n=1 Tax=Parasteatoda tepidariorum TaxID=114398 RepID=UPI001C726D6B|nr:protein SHQ1 homolog [Parasteatoda tepidariorum]XP_042912415.1 protein SHQ1 homolog [Parasteatoda tepidariorum]
MLTPAFELSQTDKFLVVSIQVPFAKVSDVQVEFEDHDFMFYSKPYFLRLNLPGRVTYTEEPSIKYDFDKRIFIINVPKVQAGEVFENLDLITKLLAPKKGKTNPSPLIEVIEGCEDIESDEEFDWSIEQVPSSDDFGTLNIIGQQCGFGNSYSFSVFNLKEEAVEIFDVEDPQNKTPKMKREERLKMEAEKFDEDHYIADLYEDDIVQQVLKYQPDWELLYEEMFSDSSQNVDDKIVFTTEEKEKLMKLPNKEYLLNKMERMKAFYSLIDILFAYAYNKRTTEGENTVESAWSINKLSATLSWLETYESIVDVARTCIRRSLCYPLCRHFELSVTVLEDVRKILLLGRKYVIKCLLEIHQLFNLSEPRYILNDLFITDFCIWMQSKKCSTRKLEPLANNLGKVLLTKGDIGLNLVDIESFAAVAWMSQANPKCSETNAVKSEKSCQKDTASLDTLNCDLSKLSLSDSGDENENNCENFEGSQSSTSSESYSDYEICSSCTSHCSESDLSTFESSESCDENDNVEV